MFRFIFFLLRLTLSCGVTAGVCFGFTVVANYIASKSQPLPAVPVTLVAMLVSLALGIDVFLVLGRLGHGQEDFDDDEPTRRRSKGGGNSGGLGNPRHALVEHLMVAGHGQLSQGDVEALQATINNAVKAARIEDLSPVDLRGKGVTALADRKYGLVVWALCRHEVTQVKISVYYAERNKMKWRPRNATNWNFDGSRQQKEKTSHSLGEAGLLAMPLQFLAASYAPMLNPRRVERAESLKASFNGLLTQAVEEWLRQPPKDVQNAPSNVRLSPSGRPIRD